MLKGLGTKMAQPEFQVPFHKWATIIWFSASFPLALLVGSYVVFVSWISLYAIVVAHWTGWIGAIVQLQQKQDHMRLRKLDPDDPVDSLDS